MKTKIEDKKKIIKAEDKKMKKEKRKSIIIQHSRTPEERTPEHDKHRRGSRRSRTRSPTRSRSRSPSRSPASRRRSSRRHHSASRSRSRSPPPRSSSGRGPRAFPAHKRENPDPSRCLGVFNLSVYTTDKDVKEIFGEFGDIQKVELVHDIPTGRSRGFGFVYFENLEDANSARDKLNGAEVDGHKIRVDYSLTKRAHTPTPGHYMGFPPKGGSGGGRFEERNRGHGRDSYRDRGPPHFEDRHRGPPSRKDRYADYYTENKIFGKNRDSYKDGYYGDARRVSPSSSRSSHRVRGRRSSSRS